MFMPAETGGVKGQAGTGPTAEPISKTRWYERKTMTSEQKSEEQRFAMNIKGGRVPGMHIGDTAVANREESDRMAKKNASYTGLRMIADPGRKGHGYGGLSSEELPTRPFVRNDDPSLPEAMPKETSKECFSTTTGLPYQHLADAGSRVVSPDPVEGASHVTAVGRNAKDWRRILSRTVGTLLELTNEVAYIRWQSKEQDVMVNIGILEISRILTLLPLEICRQLVSGGHSYPRIQGTT